MGGPDAAAVLPARRAGGDLQPAELLGRQRRLPEGVVLLAPEQHPEQAREFARRGDDRDLVAAAGADALVEGVQRARVADGAPAGLDERDAAPGAEPCLEMRPWLAGASPDWRTLGSSPR